MQFAHRERGMVTVFCKVTAVAGIITFYKGNEPVMVIHATLFTTNYNYRVVQVLTTFLQSVVHNLLKN